MRCLNCGKRTRNTHKANCWVKAQQCANCYYGNDWHGKVAAMNILERALREYLSVMESEPDAWVKISKIYHDLKRVLGDE